MVRWRWSSGWRGPRPAAGTQPACWPRWCWGGGFTSHLSRDNDSDSDNDRDKCCRSHPLQRTVSVVLWVPGTQRQPAQEGTPDSTPVTYTLHIALLMLYTGLAWHCIYVFYVIWYRVKSLFSLYLSRLYLCVVCVGVLFPLHTHTVTHSHTVQLWSSGLRSLIIAHSYSEHHAGTRNAYSLFHASFHCDAWCHSCLLLPSKFWS